MPLMKRNRISFAQLSFSNVIKTMTIRQRMAVFILIAVIFSMSLMGFIRIGIMSEHLMNERNSKIDVTVELAAMSLSDPLWNYNELGVAISCEALFRDKEIGLVIVTANQQEMYRRHNSDPIYFIENLTMVEKEIVKDARSIGTVTVGFTKYYLENRLHQAVFTDLIIVLLTLLLLWILISFIVLFVTKPIYALGQGTEDIAKGNLEKRLQIEYEDEIGDLARKFNIMAEKLGQAHNEMERRVERRTQELSASNQELMSVNEEMLAMNESLQQTLEELQKTQYQLIQSEKMAALGGLVAGVAHEINTPLGNSVTMASYLRSILDEFSILCAKGQVHRKELNDFISDEEEGLKSLEVNLTRAAKLVRSFKNVATDQMVEERQIFNVQLYLEEIILTLRSRLKKTRLQLVINCPEQLKWDSYPDVFVQIITNLIMNSLVHAYSSTDEGVLTFSFREEEEQLVIEYADDGKGMEETVCKKVFEPFFTTARSNGGTGLGLYIVYNLVTQKLHGTISCSSQLGVGTKFIIKVPLNSCIVSS